jgi:5-methylcytosine-specific restriction endonuclease McrA
MRACLGPSPGVRCPGRAIIRTGSRCRPCAREYQRRRDARRGSATARGYNPEYVRNRSAVLAGGPHPCAWGCGRVATTADHLIPLAQGGGNAVENLIPSCATCNASRGSRLDWKPTRW